MAARSLNKVMLIGNLTKDPEVRYTTNGTAVASFSLATNKSWKNQDGTVEESVQFHNIVAWNKMAEICGQILKKGMKVYIEGELNTRSWEAEGKTNYKTEVKASEMIILSSNDKSKSGGSSFSEESSFSGESEQVISADSDSGSGSNSNDDLPF